MGSLKDEMRGFKEEHQPCEKTEDGGHPVSSGCSSSAEGRPLHTSRESTTQEDSQPKRDMNVSSVEERNKCPITKDQLLSGVDCDNTEQSGSEHVKDSAQINVVPLTPQTTAAQNIATISVNLHSDGDPVDKNMASGRGQEADIESILVPVPPAPDPSDPRSPAPFGQHHMRTQVSLEVVQCRSVATSPMTPPEGGHSFFFPSTFGNSGGGEADAKNAELQVGRQVEFCSVATSPMTPKTPSTTAFPELTGREMVQKEEKVKQSWEQRENGQQESLTATKNAASGVKVTLEDSTQQCKQQRMGSMDQDITILVTHHGNNGEEEEEKSETYFYSTEPEMVKIDENEEVGGNNRDIKRDGKENVSVEAPAHVQDESNTHRSKMQPEETRESIKAKDSEAIENKDACEELTEASVMKPVPESPAPFGCHNIRTQVSLEVVQCQSAATSPMTPPEGDQAFYFPSSFGKCGSVGTDTKDAVLQGGTQVEFRSVATAPMTPRTPVATTFPEIKKEASLEDKIVVEKDKKKHVLEDKEEARKEVAEDKKEVINCSEKSEEKSEEKCEEPVQEVSWDEKGMTWEVYGAVVEVAVLGSAIQKHLEKQVLKQKGQSSMPPPPPLNPSATPLILQGGSGKGRSGKRGEQDGKVSRRRRNPFRLLMENMQQPHCCSRAQTSE
ncbi:uncharacterized protein gprin1 [Odontesthes bonariensis]|uniref:uncharacterized protein gprin1 n=1 Tax=Odontesthes bonariensis TaxID=219752 RepID=UPI003F586181